MFPSRRNTHQRFSNFKTLGLAGSTALMAQIALPVAIWMGQKISLTLIGGTDADFAPPIDIQQNVFAKIVQNFGIELNIAQNRRGFFPRGNGEAVYKIEPVKALKPINLKPVGNISIHACCWFSTRENKGKIEKEIEIAGNVTKSWKHPKILEISTEILETKEKAFGTGAGVYLFGKNSDIVCSWTELAKFDRKKNMKGNGKLLAETAWKRCVEDIGNGLQFVICKTFLGSYFPGLNTRVIF